MTVSEARWSILRDALRSKGNTATKKHTDVTRRPTGSFGLVKAEEVAAGAGEEKEERAYQVLRYELPPPTAPVEIRQRREEAPFALEDFRVCNANQIDNTGLVCMWPAEEVLTHFCTANAELFRGCRVLELGAGAGLAGLALAAMGVAAEVVMTDGNPTVVQLLRDNIARNQALFPNTAVSAEALHWGRYDGALGTFDIVIAADCTFFKDFHAGLVEVLHKSLRQHGMVYMFNPSRHGTLDNFAELARQRGFETLMEEDYDARVWERHQRLTEAAGTPDAGWPAYARETCYPLLLQVQWPQARLGWLKAVVLGLVTAVVLAARLRSSAPPRLRRFKTDGSAAQMGGRTAGTVKLSV